MPYWGNPCELLLTGAVDATWVDQIRSACAVKDRPLILTLDSRGGDQDDALNAHDLLRRHRAHTEARVEAGGKCHSAAALIFAAADRRVAHVSATFLVHPIAMEPPARWNAAAHRRAAAELANLDAHVYQIFAERCNRPLRRIEAAASETPMTAMSAQSLGLVDTVEW